MVVRSSGRDTRERILESAHELVLRNGFAGTSIDAILKETGLTKGAFFYHFDSKDVLARALVERYAAGEYRLLKDIVARAERLSGDPLQQVLIIVGLFEEMFDGLEVPPSGCLFAAFCYQEGMVSSEVKGAAAEILVTWRVLLVRKLRAAAERNLLRDTTDLESLADMLTVVIEGAFVVAKSLQRPQAVAEQLRHYRRYLELLFGGR